jgi:hypothetical protein
MLRDSQQYISLAWWFPLIPGSAITLLVMSANLIGNWLRDRFDPTRRPLASAVPFRKGKEDQQCNTTLASPG